MTISLESLSLFDLEVLQIARSYTRDDLEREFTGSNIYADLVKQYCNDDFKEQQAFKHKIYNSLNKMVKKGILSKDLDENGMPYTSGEAKLRNFYKILIKFNFKY